MGETPAMAGCALTIRAGQMVFGVPSGEEGVDEIVYAIDIQADDSSDSINLGGAWRGLVDGDAMLEALDKMGRE